MQKMSVSSLTVALGATLLLSGPLQAADDDGDYAIRGAGGFACERYVQAVEEQGDNVRQFVRWMEGYATGLNRLQDDTFDVSPILDPAAMANLMVSICRQNPEIAFETAVAQGMNSLSPVRERAASAAETLENDGNTLMVRRETMRRVQQALAELGHYDSSIDGLYGPGTRRAIVAFQESAELASTGLPDPDTLLNLLLARVEEE